MLFQKFELFKVEYTSIASKTDVVFEKINLFKTLHPDCLLLIDWLRYLLSQASEGRQHSNPTLNNLI